MYVPLDFKKILPLIASLFQHDYNQYNYHKEALFL